jgi:predicted nucleotidyltransferase
MELNNPFYIEVLQTLNETEVQYVLVGGLAVSYHGYSRYTGDMDLWIKPESTNMDRLYTSLLKLGYPEKTVNEIKEKREIDDPTPIKLKDDNNGLKIDLMTNLFQKEFTWQQCRDHCEIINLDSVAIPVVHINHLIQMKEKSKRLDSSMKDLVDAQELKKIKNLMGNKTKNKGFE